MLQTTIYDFWVRHVVVHYGRAIGVVSWILLVLPDIYVWMCTIHMPFWLLIANGIEVGFNAGMSINSKWCGNFMCVSGAWSCLSSAPHSLSWRRWYYHTCVVWLKSGPELEWPAPCSCGCLPLYTFYMNFLQSHSVMHLWSFRMLSWNHGISTPGWWRS